jgi:hypothetical protein
MIEMHLLSAVTGAGLLDRTSSSLSAQRTKRQE